MNSTVNGIIGESLYEIKVVANFFVFFLCLTSNLLVAYTLVKGRLTRKPFEYILLHLAISDIGTVLCTTLLNLNHLLNDYQLALGEIMCKLSRSISAYFYFLGEVEILLISCIRYRAVVFPLKTQFGITSVKRILAVCYALFLSYLIYYALHLHLINGTCQANYPKSYNRTLYHYIMLFVICVLPTAVIAFTNASVVFTLFRHEREMELDSAAARLRKKQNIRAFRISITIIVLFMVSWIPGMFSRMVIGSFGGDFKDERVWYLNYYSWISLIPAFLSNCTGPFVYGIFNRTIRRGYQKAAKSILGS